MALKQRMTRETPTILVPQWEFDKRLETYRREVAKYRDDTGTAESIRHRLWMFRILIIFVIMYSLLTTVVIGYMLTTRPRRVEVLDLLERLEQRIEMYHPRQ